ncbi:MAG: hypothetical protein E7005_07975 [Alphaproteobacteria bacterium]|nr:hypothetical protein [Alphaproteobacteria bacterium]
MKTKKMVNALFSSAFRVVQACLFGLFVMVGVSSCDEMENFNPTETGGSLEKYYNFKGLEVSDDVKDSLALSVVTFEEEAVCVSDKNERRDTYYPEAYLNVSLAKELIEVKDKENLPVKLVKSYLKSKTPYSAPNTRGYDFVKVFEFDDEQVATVSYGYRYSILVFGQDTIVTPHVVIDDVNYNGVYNLEKDGEKTETEDPYKLTLEFDIDYSDRATTTTQKKYTTQAHPWYKKVITEDPTVVTNVSYDGSYVGCPVEAYEVKETVTTNKGSFENFYKVLLNHLFKAPDVREQPTADSLFNDVSTGVLKEELFKESKNADGFTVKTMQGTYTSSNKGNPNKTIVESVATFTYDTPVKLETEYGTHKIEPLKVSFEELGFAIEEKSKKETEIVYNTFNYVAPKLGSCTLDALEEKVILKLPVQKKPDVVRVDSTYVLSGSGDEYIVDKTVIWSDGNKETSKYVYNGSHSISKVDFGEKITSSLDWNAQKLEEKTTSTKTEEKKFSEAIKFSAVYTSREHTSTATNGKETGYFKYKETTPVVTFIDGNITKKFDARVFVVTDMGAKLNTVPTEIVKDAVAYKVYDYDHTISYVWDKESAETLVSNGKLLVTADETKDPVYDAKQTWNGNTTTVKVTKTIPHTHAEDEVSVYTTQFTISMKDLTDDKLYAENTSFNLSEKLTSDNTKDNKDGFFTVSERTRTYDYLLSNGAVDRTMSTTLKDAVIVFNDGTFNKTFDVKLSLDKSESWGNASESGEYNVTPHTLKLTAKTVDGKTLSADGKTDIYVKKPKVDPVYEAKQTWSGNTTTVQVTKTIPNPSAEDEVSVYTTQFTISMTDLADGKLYAENTSFNLSEKLTSDNTSDNKDGFFTVSERSRTYDYLLSNGAVDRTMSTTLKDAVIVFNDGTFNKTFDVKLSLNKSESWGNTSESGDYEVTPHTLMLVASTVDGKTLSADGKTDIYVEKPAEEPDGPNLGKPKGFTVTATFDPTSQVTRRAFCFNWEKGVTYAVCVYETMLPKASDFKYKVDSYTQYNSAAYHGKDGWVPARATAQNENLRWFDSSGKLISAVDKGTCKAVGWKNLTDGKYAVVIEGYTYTINGYNITITAPNGEKVTFNSQYAE